MIYIICHCNEYDDDCDRPGVKLINLTFRAIDDGNDPL